jgi:hypothetical protein
VHGSWGNHRARRRLRMHRLVAGLCSLTANLGLRKTRLCLTIKWQGGCQVFLCDGRNGKARWEPLREVQREERPQGRGAKTRLRPISLADRHRGQDRGSELAPPDVPCQLRAYHGAT